MKAAWPRFGALLCLSSATLLSCKPTEREIIADTVETYCDRAFMCDPTIDRAAQCERPTMDAGSTADARGDVCLRSWEQLMLCVAERAPCAEVPMPLSSTTCMREADGFASSCTEL